MKQEYLPITEIEKVQSYDRARTSFTKGGIPYPLLYRLSYHNFDVSVGAVGAAAPTDFCSGAFAPTLFIKNSISLLIKLAREFKYQKSAPTDLKVLTRALVSNLYLIS